MKSRGIIIVLAVCGIWLGILGAQETKSPEQSVNQLIPRLGATNVSERYDAQMELQALAVKSARPGAKAERVGMARILAARAADAALPQPARLWCVRQLEYIGDAESVTTLAALLNGTDAELREAARRALEKNPSPTADAILRTALQQGGDAKWKIGLIQSLGQRGDGKAVALIQSYLGDPQIGGAAAAALAKIGSSDAIGALWAAYDAGNPVAADALVLAGAHLIKADESAKAEKIFQRLYLATPKSQNTAGALRVRCASLVGLAKANPKEARKYIVADLEGTEARLQYAAVTAAGLAYGKDKVTGELAPLLPKLSPTAKVYVLRQLDSSAEAQVISLIEDPDERVKIAAIETLGRIGGPAGVPVLIKAVAASSPAQKAATAALARLPGPGTDAAIAKQAAQGDTAARGVAIAAMAARNDKSSLPALLKYAGESDPKISEAACSALAKLGTDAELEALAGLAMTGKTPGADAALKTVASRATDKSSAAKKLAALAPSVQPEQAALLFETLAVLGGGDAFAAVTNSVSSRNEQIKDAAVRALANWPDFAAAGPLLVIAADPNAKRVHQVLAIQGVVRLVKSSENERAEARLAAAMRAMASATRDEDKKLVLSAFAAIPDVKAAEAIKPYLSDAKLENEAGLAGVTLAESLRKTDKTAADDLAQAVKNANVSDELTRKANAVLGKN